MALYPLTPSGVPNWGRIFDEVLAERPDWVDTWNLGVIHVILLDEWVEVR